MLKPDFSVLALLRADPAYGDDAALMAGRPARTKTPRGAEAKHALRVRAGASPVGKTAPVRGQGEQGT